MSENVKQFIHLQTKVNNQIDLYGQADHSTVDELMDLSDRLTPEEIDEVVRWAQ